MRSTKSVSRAASPPLFVSSSSLGFQEQDGKPACEALNPRPRRFSPIRTMAGSSVGRASDDRSAGSAATVDCTAAATAGGVRTAGGSRCVVRCLLRWRISSSMLRGASGVWLGHDRRADLIVVLLNRYRRTCRRNGYDLVVSVVVEGHKRPALDAAALRTSACGGARARVGALPIRRRRQRRYLRGLGSLFPPRNPRRARRFGGGSSA